ncbi:MULTISPECIES: LytR/AlgR family response regulator transcription factor [Sutcliffiella]|uniref:DNA-binding response regulator n=1 Tax=Sutcliffiella cohnii TaxID=33932 RepID=A0A223KSL0_9BACI|nr:MULTISPECIES: LytTR family DNA-binding domain-containing protein [Sutcliffiella]AST92492.1 DNA-binding response regulator [Sutcliffiella cohnii]MED4017031.1 LytTR family DNA-binding domain-containing protein [Sutcliffiella cohnii]WBL13729.1 LytTR family DNA-binding domain-containing protein [Sutcliffiella sp. NC1]
MDQKIKILVVDDEPYSREELKHLLSLFPSTHIVGEADSGESAIMKTMQHQPDVVFLDVEMPKMDGMTAAKSLMELKKPPLIVFATAYPQFAVEAFRFNAMDYLLKPFDEEQLKETINRLEQHYRSIEKQDVSRPTGKLAVECDGEIFYLEPKEILYISREEKLTKIVTKNKEFETKTPLKDLETRLVTFGFFRIHKSFLVNLHYVSRLTPWFNGAYQLELDGREEQLSVSRNYVKALRKRLEI